MLTSNNLCFNVDKIKECIEEIKPTEPREELLAKLTYEKLKLYNEDYMVKFNKIVDDIYDCAVNNNIKNMSTLLKRLSKVSHSVFDAELNLYIKLLRYNENDKERNVQ